MIQYLHISHELKAGAAMSAAAAAGMLSQMQPAEPSWFHPIIQGGSFALVVVIFLWLALRWWPQHRADQKEQYEFLLNKLLDHYDGNESEHKELVGALKENTRALREFKQESVEELRRLGEAQKQVIDSLKGGQ